LGGRARTAGAAQCVGRSRAQCGRGLSPAGGESSGPAARCSARGCVR
jgi:hypothetical protein